VANILLFLTKVSVKSCIYAQAFQTTVIYSSDLFTYNAKYFQTLSGEKWRSFANSLRGMLILRSTVHEAAGNLTILPTVLDYVCLAGSFIQLLLGHYSVRIGYQREQNYIEKNSSQACFLNHTFTFCAIGLLDKSCM